MKSLDHIFVFLLLVWNSSVISQPTSYEPELKDWIPNNQAEYSGIYDLGQNERQAFLRVFSTENHLVFQVKTNFQYEVGEPRDIRYLTFSNPTIDKTGIVSFGEIKGQFVKYIDFFGDTIHCLNFYPPITFFPASEKDYELGRKNSKLTMTYNGKYPQSSTIELTNSDLTNMDFEELRIMRNEIFARYGYIFKEGGEMNKYFNRQPWYKPELVEVNELLTELEKANIKLIQSVESQR
ncbi:MAG: YARHG domain-containing protein [Cyclobacteriaceae bacterium]